MELWEYTKMAVDMVEKSMGLDRIATGIKIEKKCHECREKAGKERMCDTFFCDECWAIIEEDFEDYRVWKAKHLLEEKGYVVRKGGKGGKGD